MKILTVQNISYNEKYITSNYKNNYSNKIQNYYQNIKLNK